MSSTTSKTIPRTPELHPPNCSCCSVSATMTGTYVLPAVKSADRLTVSAPSVRANEALRSSESERRRRDASSGGVLSSETVKEYVPDSSGVKDGRTARIVEAESELVRAAADEALEVGQMIVTPPSR